VSDVHSWPHADWQSNDANNVMLMAVRCRMRTPVLQSGDGRDLAMVPQLPSLR